MNKWIKFFLQDRPIQCAIEPLQQKELFKKDSLSCTLFLTFINDLPSMLKTLYAAWRYADGLVIWVSQKYHILAKVKL